MKDVSRLAVGIALLGLAIFLTVDFDNSATPITESQESLANNELEPEWQAAAAPQVSDARKQELATAVRPQFDHPSKLNAQPLSVKATPVATSAGTLVKPTFVKANFTHASSTPTTQAVLSVKGELVPVQPKPSFAGSISVLQKMHTVRAGDSLTTIAREYFGDAERYLDIYLLNKDVLANPTQLPIGVEIKIPGQ